MRRVTMLLVAVVLGVLLAGGAAFAAIKIGDNGNNTLRGTNSADSLLGRGGNDKIYGLGSADTLNGGSGADKIYGGVRSHPTSELRDRFYADSSGASHLSRSVLSHHNSEFLRSAAALTFG